MAPTDGRVARSEQRWDTAQLLLPVVAVSPYQPEMHIWRVN